MVEYLNRPFRTEEHCLHHFSPSFILKRILVIYYCVRITYKNVLLWVKLNFFFFTTIYFPFFGHICPLQINDHYFIIITVLFYSRTKIDWATLTDKPLTRVLFMVYGLCHLHKIYIFLRFWSIYLIWSNVSWTI